MFCKAVVAMFLLFMPAPLLAAEAGAMLYVKGQARLNGGSVPSSSAIFAGDMVQTETDSAANINALGSNIAISQKSRITFEQGGINLEQGAVVVATSKGAAVHVGNLTVAPAHSSWTQFEISNSDGTIHILARKGDLSVSDESGTLQLPEGQETTRTETKSKRRDGGRTGRPGADTQRNNP